MILCLTQQMKLNMTVVYRFEQALFLYRQKDVSCTEG